MKNYLAISIIFSLIFFTSIAHAGLMQDIRNIARDMSASTGYLNNINSSEQAILASQRDIDGLMKQVNNNIVGGYGWGSYQYHDYGSYGTGATSWAEVMQMAQSGSGNNSVGQAMNGVANQYPIDTATFNRSINGSADQYYYANKSQTLLAVRAASQVDYDKIQDQINYQQMLQQQIEKTTNLKAAMDLANRIQVEGNLINLEVLRQLTLANQQQAISGQADINSALSNAKFLTKN